MISEKMSDLTVYESRTLRKTYGPVNAKGRWRVRKNKVLQNVLRGADIVIKMVWTLLKDK